jgi:predicted enzyme related to lactoylglutathione lyase
LAAVVGKGGAKNKSAIPVRGPSVAVFGAGEGKTELARRVEGVGGEVIRETVEARPSRE